MSLTLPRDAVSVALVRKTLSGVLQVLGVVESCITDLEVALTEACSNVIHHTTGTDKYEVSYGIDPSRCRIAVADSGCGFDSSNLPGAPEVAESGRGIALMRAMVDRLSFEQIPDDGTVVHLEKDLTLYDDAALTRPAALTGGEPAPR